MTSQLRAKLLDYAAQDRKDAAFFKFAGEEKIAQNYIQRALELEAKAGA